MLGLKAELSVIMGIIYPDRLGMVMENENGKYEKTLWLGAFR